MKDLSKFINRWITIFSVVFISYFLIMTGMSLQKQEWAGAILLLLLAAFWSGLLIVVYLSSRADLTRSIESRHSEEMEKVFDEVTKILDENVKAETHKITSDKTAFIKLLDKYTDGEMPPTTEQLEQIKREFFELTSKFVDIELVQGGMKIAITDKPTPPKSSTTKAKETSKKKASNNNK